MKVRRLKIELDKADDLKIIKSLSRVQPLPAGQTHKSKKAYSRRQKFKKEEL